MTAPFTPPDPVSELLYEEALTQRGLYLSDELVPEWALLEEHLDPGKKYAVFLMCEYSASRPMGMIPYERPWEDDDDLDDGGGMCAFDSDEAWTGSGQFCIGTFNQYGGTRTVAAVQQDKDAIVTEMIQSLVKQYPQVLSVKLLGIFAQTLPVPNPARPEQPVRG